MRRISYFIIICIFSTICFSCKQSIQNKKETITRYQQSLCIDDTIKSIGDIYKSKTKTASCTFLLTNNGKKPIVINKVETFCNCIKAN